MEIELERKLITLEHSVKDIDERLAELYREAGGLSLRNASALRRLGSEVAESRKRAEEIRKLHADFADGLKNLESARRKAAADTPSKTVALEKKIEDVRARANSVLREIYDSVDALKADVGELRKGAVMPAPAVDGGMPAGTEKLSRELERLAERLAVLESPKDAGVAKDDVDIRNLKLAVAELSNKNRLINELALENQKMQNRMFTLEEKLRALNPSEKT